MAFKRTNFGSLVAKKNEYFASSYKFSTKANFKVGSDVYVIPLGLETGYYETPCHRILPHKVDGKLVGYNGLNFAVYVKCQGIDEEGNRSESLCCTLAKMEKERIPEKENSGNRIISFATNRVHIPVLILGNILNDDSKISYPVTKVSITKDLDSEKGLKFAYLDMASNTFNTDIVAKYGEKLKGDGTIEYDLEDNSEELFEAVREQLTKTVIKIHGVSKSGFSAAMKEYSFFSFEDLRVGKDSGEHEAIANYKDNEEIMNKVNEFLELFDSEVDNLVQNWNEKDLTEYYNSAVGVPLDTPIDDIQAQLANKAKSEQEETSNEEENEEVEIVKEQKETTVTTKKSPSFKQAEAAEDDELNAFMASVGDDKPKAKVVEEDFVEEDFEMEDDEFFSEE